MHVDYYYFSGISLVHWLSRNVLFVDLPIMHVLLATRQRVSQIKDT